MAKKENQRILLTKRMLQNGLLQLLEDHALDKISVTELCRVSGINRATFYNHYTSPQDLLNSIQENIAQDLINTVHNPGNSDEVFTHVEKICEYFHEHAGTILTLHKCNADSRITNALYKINQEFQMIRLNERFQRYAPHAQAQGLHLISTFFFSGCYHLILEWLDKEIPATPKEIANLLIVMVRDNFLE